MYFDFFFFFTCVFVFWTIFRFFNYVWRFWPVFSMVVGFVLIICWHVLTFVCWLLKCFEDLLIVFDDFQRLLADCQCLWMTFQRFPAMCCMVVSDLQLFVHDCCIVFNDFSWFGMALEARSLNPHFGVKWNT